MKSIFDLFPVLLFFAAYKISGDIYVATASAIVATFAQIGWVWYRHRKVEKMLWATLAIIVFFGGATLLFHNETFIKWKPTALYWVFAATLLITELRFHKNLIRSMMAKQMSLPDATWRKVLLSWVCFFAAMGILNLYVAYNFSTGAWVNFKLFGILGLMLVFGILQALMLGKYINTEDPKP